MTRTLEAGAQRPPAPAPGSARSFALLYCPARLRAEFALLQALEAEIGAGLARRLDHALAHARLDWWGEEAARYRAGTARHPWLRVPEGAAAPVRCDLAALVHAALVDLAEGQHGTARARRLRGAIFCTAAAGLDALPLTPSEQAALATLGALSAELEPAPAPAEAAADTLERLALAIAGIAAPRQRAWVPLLVWCALGARQATHTAAASPLAGFADNIAAWRAARAAAAGRLRID